MLSALPDAFPRGLVEGVMHGLINKAIEAFVIETYGRSLWLEATERAGLGFHEFEAMLIYEGDVTDRTIAAIGEVLTRPPDSVLEDLGTFLVASPSIPAFRRLLRFGGVTYEDFLHSLEELPDRVRLAVDDLILPELSLHERGQNRFHLRCHPGFDGYGHVMMGMLRTMADDYGTLAMLDHHGHCKGSELIEIAIVQDAFSEGKAFVLGEQSA